MVTYQIPGVPGSLAAVLEQHDEASWGYGWGIASHEKWDGYYTHRPGTFSHSGATGSTRGVTPSTSSSARSCRWPPCARTGWP